MYIHFCREGEIILASQPAVGLSQLLLLKPLIFYVDQWAIEKEHAEMS